MAGAVIASTAILAIAAAERQELQADQKTRCWRRQAVFSVHEATGGDVYRECRSVRCNTRDKQLRRHKDHDQAQHHLGKLRLAPGFGLKTLLCPHMKAAVAEPPTPPTKSSSSATARRASANPPPLNQLPDHTHRRSCQHQLKPLAPKT